MQTPGHVRTSDGGMLYCTGCDSIALAKLRSFHMRTRTCTHFHGHCHANAQTHTHTHTHPGLYIQVALLHPKRRLQPRTYRVAVGYTLLVGGVARLDVLQIPGATIYLTVFASSAVACHLSKTDNISERYAQDLYSCMRPPTVKTADDLPPPVPLVPVEVQHGGPALHCACITLRASRQPSCICCACLIPLYVIETRLIFMRTALLLVQLALSFFRGITHRIHCIHDQQLLQWQLHQSLHWL